MKKRARLVLTLLCILLLPVLAVTAGACAFTNPGTMKRLKGTYVLEKYTCNYASETENEDYMLKRGITAYLIVTGDEYGYYVYQDSGMENPACMKIKITYGYETDSDKISTVNYQNKSPYGTVLHQKIDLGFKNNQRILSAVEHNVYDKSYTNISYKHKSSATDLSYAERALGCKLELPS